MCLCKEPLEGYSPKNKTPLLPSIEDHGKSIWAIIDERVSMITMGMGFGIKFGGEIFRDCMVEQYQTLVAQDQNILQRT